MMEVSKRSHETQPNLLQWYYPATPPEIQDLYAHRSRNRYVPVQQLMWPALMQWSNRRYELPGYILLGTTSWALPLETAKAAGAYAAVVDYGLTGNTARRLGADYAVY